MRNAVALAAALLLASVGARADPPTPSSRPEGTAQVRTTTNPTPAPSETPTPVTVPGAPVVFAGSPLFTLRSRVGSFSPEDRAAAITRRIEGIAQNPLLGEPEITVAPSEGGAAVMFKKQILLVVTEADAQGTNLTPVELAERWARTIHDAVAERHRSFTLRTLALGAGAALLATILLLVVLKLLARALPAALRLIDSGRGKGIPSVRIQRLELLPSERIADFLAFSVRLIRTALVILALYVYIPSVLGFFPWTQGLSHTLFGYLLTPVKSAGQALLAFLPNLFFLIVIGVLTRYAIRVIRLVFREIERENVSLPGFDTDWAEPTYKIVRFLVIVFAVIIAYPYLPGSSSRAFQGVSLFLGVLFSLGSSSAIANVVSGVILTYTGAFKLGDRVKIADTVGDIIEKTLLVTRVRTIKNVEITIPNSLVLGNHITNFSAAAKHKGLILNTTVTIGYDAPWRQVHELLIGAARRTEGILAEPAPFVLQLSLDDYYPSYEINAYTDDASRMAVTYSLLHASIQDAFNEAGVEIMSPAYHAVRDGNRIAIPDDYLPKGYRAPGFRLGGGRPSGARGGSADEDR